VAQTTLNPDLSLIGDVRGFSHNDGSRPAEKQELNLADPEMELMISGYLNPYARADAVVAWHPGADAAVEEVYATIMRGLPFGMNLRAGKYLLEFGRLNPVHPHAWSFVQRPLPHYQFFGDHGLLDMAIRTSFLLPTGDVYTEAMGALVKGDALLEHHHEKEETVGGHNDEHDTDDRVDLGFFGRLTTSFALSDHAELALGASVVNSVYGEEEHHDHEHEGEALEAILISEEIEHTETLRAWVGGIDVKYKYRPSRYTSLQIEGEGLIRREEQDDGAHLTSYGGYAYMDYRFRQKYNVGGIFEYVRLKESVHHHEEDDHHDAENLFENDKWRMGLFVGFAPVEETSLVRLVGHWTEPEESEGFWEVTLQFVFSLGPHKPHNF
jgi:hypothetical protein